jgi:hypothetical protein
VVVGSATDGCVGTVVGVAHEERRTTRQGEVELGRSYLVTWPTRTGRHVTNQVPAGMLRAANEEEPGQ